MVASPQLLIDSGAAVGLPTCKSQRPLVVNRSRPAMNMLFEACLVGSDEEQLASVAEACLAEVQRLDRRLCRTHSQSETARINREAVRNAVLVDYELAELLRRCHIASQRTEGWFDIAAGQAWSLKNRGVEFLEFDTQLDFSAIAKGCALDRAAELLDEFLIADALLHAGTHTVLAKGNGPAGRGWQIRVRNPVSDLQGAELTVELEDEALAVLCTTELRTRGEQQAAVAVVAKSGFDADALATALLAMGRQRSINFLSAQPGLRSVAWLDEVTLPHQGKWHWLCGDR